MYFVKSPALLCKFYHPDEVWSIDTEEKIIYLTFDDGPVQDVTPWVLHTLKEFNAKATFFCIGENVYRNPQVLEQILMNGHAIGNHTFNHLNGWRSPLEDYVENVMKCNELFHTTLFRPPYGRIRRNQMLKLRAHFNIVFWSMLTGDFDENTGPAKCLKNAISGARPGAIIVFHDSIRAWPNLKYALPKFLEALSVQGYTFSGIPYGIKSMKDGRNLLKIDYN